MCLYYFIKYSYTCKQFLIIIYKMSLRTRDKFGKFISRFERKTKTLFRKLKRILIKFY